MAYIFKINTQEPTLNQFEIEADSYHLGEGFFTFTERAGQSTRPVASVDAKRVFNIERTNKE